MLTRDVGRLAYVATDGTPRVIPIAFTWNGTHLVMCTTKNAPKLPALRRDPVVALTIDTRGAPADDAARPRHGRARCRRRHPGGVSPDERHVHDDARAAGRVGGGGPLALRRDGPDRRDPDVGEAHRLRDDAAERCRGAGPGTRAPATRLSPRLPGRGPSGSGGTVGS